MATLKRISRCCGAALIDQPAIGELTVVRCEQCGSDYIDLGTWECTNSHPVAANQSQCNKCKSSDFVPTVKWLDTRPRCGVCGEIRAIIAHNGDEPCEAVDRNRNCPYLSVSRAAFAQRNKHLRQIPEFVRRTQLTGPHEYVVVDTGVAGMEFQENARWNRRRVKMPLVRIAAE